MAGVEAADSWATDGHKWLNVPFDCGIAIVRDREAHRAAMTISASYLVADDRARDELDWTPEFSRRGRGYTVYAAIRELGREGLEALVDRSCAHCKAIVTGIGGLKGAEALWVSELNQGLVRFRDPRAGATEEDHDQYTDRVIAGINATGEAFFSGTTWRGRRAMRVSVVNWRTSERDVSRAVGGGESAGRSFAALRMTTAEEGTGNGNREQGTGNREQGTGNREQGRGKREEGRGKREEYALQWGLDGCRFGLQYLGHAYQRVVPRRHRAARHAHGHDRRNSRALFAGVG